MFSTGVVDARSADDSMLQHSLRDLLVVYLQYLRQRFLRFARGSFSTRQPAYLTVAGRVMDGWFLRSLLSAEGPEIGPTIQYRQASSAASRVSRPFLARFGPGLGLGFGLRGWGVRLYLSMPPRKCFPAREREQPTAPKIRATKSLGEQTFSFAKVSLKSYHLNVEKLNVRCCAAAYYCTHLHR